MTWTLPPSFFGDTVEEDLGKLRSEVALRLHRSIVLKTPVDTGRARGSHAVSYSSPRPSSGGINSVGQTLASGAATIASRAQSPYEIIYIASSLPYIGKLEFGSSRQAPEGMYRVSIASVKARYGK